MGGVVLPAGGGGAYHHFGAGAPLAGGAAAAGGVAARGAKAFPAELPRPRRLRGIEANHGTLAHSMFSGCGSRPPPDRRGTHRNELQQEVFSTAHLSLGLKGGDLTPRDLDGIELSADEAFTDGAEKAHRRRALKSLVRSHAQGANVDEVAELRRLFRAAASRAVFEGPHPAVAAQGADSPMRIGWAGYCELVGWLYPGVVWPEAALHATLVGAGVLPREGEGGLHPGGGSTVEVSTTACERPFSLGLRSHTDGWRCVAGYAGHLRRA